MSGGKTTKGTEAKRARAILDERARALARPPAAEVRAGDRLEVLVFALSGETYAIEAAAVREVTRLADYTVVPGAPSLLFGVTNFRGEVLPIFDLRRLTGLAVKGLTDLSRLLVLGEERDEIGLVADEVRDVQALSRDAILDPPPALAGIGRELLLGVTGGATMVLSARGLLRDPRLFLDQDEGPGERPARRDGE
jgi:purine-binding chemotaxis protein CheW